MDGPKTNEWTGNFIHISSLSSSVPSPSGASHRSRVHARVHYDEETPSGPWAGPPAGRRGYGGPDSSGVRRSRRPGVEGRPVDGRGARRVTYCRDWVVVDSYEDPLPLIFRNLTEPGRPTSTRVMSRLSFTEPGRPTSTRVVSRLSSRVSTPPGPSIPTSVDPDLCLAVPVPSLSVRPPCHSLHCAGTHSSPGSLRGLPRPRSRVVVGSWPYLPYESFPKGGRSFPL